MGQTKKLLDSIFEFDFDNTSYPDDLDMDYEIWLEEKKEAERAAYEEHLADQAKFHNFA
jgi:hypothetical protein